MQVTPIHIDAMRPPKDDLLEKVRQSTLSLREGDCVAIASKVVSIWEGRCEPGGGIPEKDALAVQEAERYLPREATPGGAILHTIKHGYLVGSAGIDSNNADGYFVLWPKDPKASAEKLLAWLKETYKIKKLYLVITDSHSTPLRRGAMGFALGWAGFNPLYDHSGEPDVFGQKAAQGSTTNLADSLAATAVLAMGEVGEQTPVVVIRDAPYLDHVQSHTLDYELTLETDIFAPFLNVDWKPGGMNQ